jgi:hypothetical protein
MNSAFARISQPVNSDTRRNRTSGVWPMKCSIPKYRREPVFDFFWDFSDLSIAFMK